MKRLALTVAAILLSLSLSAQSLEDKIIGTLTAVPDSVQCRLMDAVRLMDEQQYDNAAAILDSLSAMKDAGDAVFYYKGMCALNRWRPEDAVRDLERAADMDPDNNWYLDALATAYVAAGNGDGAMDIYAKLAERNPRKYRSPYTLALVADAYRLSRDYEKYFTVLEAIAGDSGIGAEENYKYLLSACGGFSKTALTDLYPNILKVADALAQAHPQDPDAYRLKMEFASFMNDHETVVGTCTRMIALSRDEEQISQLYGILGDSMHKNGPKGKAYKMYRNAIRINPDNVMALNNYAYALATDGHKLKKAEEMSRKSIEAEPDNASYLDTYGWILHLLGRDREAKPHFKHAMIYGGKDSATVLAHYAEVLDALGESDLARYYRSLSESK